MSKKVLIINIGWEQEPLIFALKERGFLLYGISNHVMDSSFFEKIYVVDYRNLDEIYNVAIDIMPDAVISDQCDYSHYAQAMISERLNLCGPSLFAAQVSSNKFVQRSLALKKGILIPSFKLVFSYEEVESAAFEIGFPVIVKPIDNRGSFGVSKINNLTELKEGYFSALINSHSRFVLIEQYIEGYEITVDGYCFNKTPKSLTVALKSKEGLTSQVSMDIKYPAEIPSEVYEKALINNEFVAKSLGYSFGMIHSEYIVNAKNEIFLVESANRGGGVFTSEIIVPKVSGVDVLTRYIDDVLGLESSIDAPIIVEKNPVILKFFSFNTGKIKFINGIESINRNEGVLAFRLNVNVGDCLEVIENDGSRHGFVIFESPNNLRDEVLKIIDLIHIEYDE
jgi:biotin carboxylase